MEKGLENIDKVFKQAFEGFEANVDPSIWSNIQNSIASGTVTESSVKPNLTTTSVVGKSLALKLVTGVLAISSIGTGAYFITDNLKTDEDKIVNSNLVIDEHQRESKVLSVDEKVLKVDRPFTEVKNHLKEEVLVVAVSLEQRDIDVLKELVNSTTDKVVESSQENLGSKNERLEEINLQESSKEEKTKLVREKIHPNVTTKEVEVLKGAIRANVTKGDAPLDVSFDVEGEGVVSYSWDFGDNSSTSSDESSFHTFKEPGRYKVELIILDKNANTETLIEYIEVESTTKPSLGFVPNAFSPNGDGLNDVYKFTTTRNIKSFNARVLNPNNGSVVFQWNSIDGGWDGKDFSGTKLNIGPYYLAVQAVGFDGSVIHKNLRINLLDE